MNRIIAFLLFSMLASHVVLGAWYWPFNFEDDDKKPPRISELMEEASILIDTASDYAAQNKISEAIETYKKAYVELEKLEFNHPERAATGEFATVRNKKAYVEVAIDSLLLQQVSDNVRVVTVTDTTELEKRFAEENNPKTKQPAANQGDVKKNNGLSQSKKQEITKKSEAKQESLDSKKDFKEVPKTARPEPTTVKPEPTKIIPELPKVSKNGRNPVKYAVDRKSRMMLAVEDMRKKDYEGAKLIVKELLQEKPNDAAALNLKAAIEADSGDLKAAESTLHQLILSNPKSYIGYYNIAKLILKTRGASGKQQALRYYENGREYCNGPVDKELEAMLK